MSFSKAVRAKQQPVSTSKVVGTDQQEAFWAALVESLTEHMVLRARAGTGKTFSLVEGANRLLAAHPNHRIILCCYNKAIAMEASTKVPPKVWARTQHSLGKAMLEEHLGGQVAIDGRKPWILLKNASCSADFKSKAAIIKYASLVKNILPYEMQPTWEHLEFIQDRYGVDIKVDQTVLQWVHRLLKESKAVVDMIDFDDMIWLPVQLGLVPSWRADTLLVDEAQDLNPCQQELSLLLGKRIVPVGDDRQSIYGFRGADVHSLDTMQELLGGCKVLPLTKTFRCPKSHVERAKQWVPDFEANEANVTGSIHHRDPQEMRDALEVGDLVMCRINAPTLAQAFALMREGKRVAIQGRDLGGSLVSLGKDLSRKGPYTEDVCELLKRLEKYEAKQVEQFQQEEFVSERKIQQLLDKTSCFRILADGMDSLKEMEERSKKVFADMDVPMRDRITLSSVHRAKGLEAPNTYILRPDLQPFPAATEDWELQQENNLLYVAGTRSMATMTFVHGRC